MSFAAFDAPQNQEPQHLMVDIETLATDVDAPVIAIGATTFNPYKLSTFHALKERSFYRGVNIEDAVKHSGPPSGATLAWWFSQDDKAIKRLVTGELVTLQTALKDFIAYATFRGRTSPMPERYRSLAVPKFVWAKSPDFDCKILEHACRRMGLQWPFHYAYSRCVRTITDIAFPDPEERPEFTGVAHDARDDAINQALTVQQCFKALGQGTDDAEFLP